MIKKAVIAAAGLGTRVLPATKAIPKEMLPIVDKPAIQFIVEETVASGIEDILIITSRGKSALVDHFDRAPELETRLAASNKQQSLDEVLKLSSLANIHFIRQTEIKGLGHAILMAKSFIGSEPFAVLYGDDVIIGETPACKELIGAYKAHGKSVVGIKEVSDELIVKYSSMKVSPLGDKTHLITDMNEKPTLAEKFSNYSVLGRCILDPVIFDILEKTEKGAGGEIQLTDAMKVLSRREGMVGYEFSGTRYDMGNKVGIMKAQVEYALMHPETKDEFKEYLIALAKSL